MKIVGMKECASALAQKRGIPKSEAESIMRDCLRVISDKIVSEGGVSVKGLFTIKKKFCKGRSGVCKGVEWKTEDHYSLTIKTGSEFDEMLNK